MTDKKRIAITSNYDDERFNESFLNTYPLDNDRAHEIAQLLNGQDLQSDRYHKVVDLDYTLHKFQP